LGFSGALYDQSVIASQEQVLNDAGWKYIEPDLQINALAGTIEIQIWTHTDSGRNTDAAMALARELSGRSIATTLISHYPQRPKDNKIEVIVGSKF
jgi:hypothetical protein